MCLITYVLLWSLQLAWLNANNFSRLIECKLIILNELDWLESLMVLLQNSPNLSSFHRPGLLLPSFFIDAVLID